MKRVNKKDLEKALQDARKFKKIIKNVELIFVLSFFVLILVWIFFGWSIFWKIYLSAIVLYIPVYFFSSGASEVINKLQYLLNEPKRKSFKERLKEKRGRE